MRRINTYRQQLRDIATGQFGYVTTRDAERAGVPAVELRKLTARGGFEHIARGVYRLEDAPYDHRAVFKEVTLIAGDGAYLTGTSVLALHDLALVNPRKLHVATARRTQARFPSYMTVVPARDDQDLTTYDGIPSTTVEQAFLDCRDRVMPDRLLAAIPDARQRGLLTARQAHAITTELLAYA